jgi:hypothetical protein
MPVGPGTVFQVVEIKEALGAGTLCYRDVPHFQGPRSTGGWMSQ